MNSEMAKNDRNRRKDDECVFESKSYLWVNRKRYLQDERKEPCWSRCNQQMGFRYESSITGEWVPYGQILFPTYRDQVGKIRRIAWEIREQYCDRFNAHDPIVLFPTNTDVVTAMNIDWTITPTAKSDTAIHASRILDLLALNRDFVRTAITTNAFKSREREWKDV